MITPFVIIEDEIFDHKPNVMSTKFGGVRICNIKTAAQDTTKMKSVMAKRKAEKKLEFGVKEDFMYDQMKLQRGQAFLKSPRTIERLKKKFIHQSLQANNK